jgi:hypothetical protein
MPRQHCIKAMFHFRFESFPRLSVGSDSMTTSDTEPNPFEPCRDAKKVDGSGFETRHVSTSAAVMARRRRT